MASGSAIRVRNRFRFAANRITQFTNSQHTGENVDYDYDNSGQLTDADYNGGLTDEGYTYDAGGNRIDVDNDFGSVTYTTGDNNLLEDDGTYTYEYDGEGNRTKRTDASGNYAVYEWDHRNRLASVSMYNSSHVLQKKFSYLYDAFDRLVGKRSDTDGNGTINATEAYVYDGDQIVLQFGDDDAAALAAGDLTHRYLWGPAVDQLLADEEVTSLTSAGAVSWALTDHLNTIRDVVQYNSGTNTTSVVNHNEYDSFGNKVGQSSPNNDVVFGYTGRIYDADTGLQWHGSADGGGRWYDAKVGRWLSEDSTRFAAGDANLYRYVYNSPTIYFDPGGLEAEYRPQQDGGAKDAKSAAEDVGKKIGSDFFDKVIRGGIDVETWTESIAARYLPFGLKDPLAEPPTRRRTRTDPPWTPKYKFGGGYDPGPDGKYGTDDDEWNVKVGVEFPF